jgi:hypothetical protein
MAIEAALPSLRKLIAEYAPKDVYNMDETGLFYRMAPSRTIAQRQIEGSKKDKTRITVALTSNTTGDDKLPPLFIGHAKQPCAFKRQTGKALGFDYSYNSKAWMTGIIFREWVLRMESKMHTAGRRVLLLLDNAPSHVAAGLELTNIQIAMLPPNATSKIQPMDAGIIASFKCRYRRLQLQHAVDRDEAGEHDIYKVDQLLAMNWCLDAWKDVTASTIANCFRHTGLFSTNDEVMPTEASDEAAITTEVVEAIQRLGYTPDLETFLNPPEETACAHQESTDEELLEAARPIDSETDATDEEMPKEAPPVLSIASQLAAIRTTIGLLEQHTPRDATLIRGLRVMQRDLCEQVKSSW